MGRRKGEAQRIAAAPLIAGMKESDILEALETAARSLSLEVRYEKGDFNGGLCRVGERNMILLRREDIVAKQISVLTRELGMFDLDKIFLVPALRDLIAQERNVTKISDFISEEEN
jgi:hypothetical protein